jgi:hypothetical protein
MTLLQLRALLAVTEQGGLTAATERMGVSQPAVSRAVVLPNSLRTTAFMARFPVRIGERKPNRASAARSWEVAGSRRG